MSHQEEEDSAVPRVWREGPRRDPLVDVNRLAFLVPPDEALPRSLEPLLWSAFLGYNALTGS